jgi:hypothetical protein
VGCEAGEMQGFGILGLLGSKYLDWIPGLAGWSVVSESIRVSLRLMTTSSIGLWSLRNGIDCPISGLEAKSLTSVRLLKSAGDVYHLIGIGKDAATEQEVCY